MKNKNNLCKYRGFSIIELMVAMSISLVVTGMILSTYIQSMYGLNDSNQRMNLAQEISKFTNEMSGAATRSNHFVLYKSSEPGHIANESSRQNLFEEDGVTYRPGGNLAVFVYYEIPKPVNQLRHRIKRIEAYALQNANSQGIGLIEHVTIDLSSAPPDSSVTLETILKDSNYYSNGRWNAGLQSNGTRVTVRTPFPMVRGLALAEHEDGVPVTSPTPRLFYLSASRNIVVMGQHYSGNNRTNSNDRRTHTNAFSFNITPRI
jgi:prepilin-type N-terminal cleavage/methylation domain-containing protein